MKEMEGRKDVLKTPTFSPTALVARIEVLETELTWLRGVVESKDAQIKQMADMHRAAAKQLQSLSQVSPEMVVYFLNMLVTFTGPQFKETGIEEKFASLMKNKFFLKGTKQALRQYGAKLLMGKKV